MSDIVRLWLRFRKMGSELLDERAFVCDLASIELASYLRMIPLVDDESVAIDDSGEIIGDASVEGFCPIAGDLT